MPKFIIVKYADQYWPNGKAPIGASIGHSYSAQKTGMQREPFKERIDAEAALEALIYFNETVGYGIVELEE